MIVRPLLVALALALTLVGPAHAEPGDALAGEWSMTAQVGGFAVTAPLKLERDGDAWRGTWGAGDEERRVAALEIDDDGAVSFRLGRRGPTFRGALADGVLAGSIEGRFGSIDCRGTKASRYAGAIGYWAMRTELAGRTIEGTLSLFVRGGALVGVMTSEFGKTELEEVAFSGDTLTFRQSMGGGSAIAFSGTIAGDALSGTFTGEFGTFASSGSRIDL